MLSGCTNDLTDLESELNNPLDSDLLKCRPRLFHFTQNFRCEYYWNDILNRYFILEDADSGAYIGGAKAVVTYDPNALEFVKAINGDVEYRTSPTVFC